MMSKSAFTLALLCGSALSASAAAAQDQATPAASAAQPAPNSQGIADIVVTAERRSETSQKAPIAIDVIQPKALAQVTEPASLTKLAPAVQFGSAGGSTPLLYIRGVGTFSANPYTDSAVAVNYDGIYLGRPTSTFGLFYDLDRVEVLKGPQGTLYGRNATGGAMNILPTQPKIGVDDIGATISVGNYQAVNAQAEANIAVSDTAAFRIAGVTYTHDGYNTDGTYSEEGRGARAQFLVKPTDKLSIRIAGDYFQLGGTGNVGVLLSTTGANGQTVPANFRPNVGPYDPRTVAVLNSVFVPTAGTTVGALPVRPFIHNNYYGVNAEINYDLDFAKLTIIPAWRRSDLNNISAPALFLLTSDEKDEQYSIEARLAGRVGPVDWLVGGYGFHETVKADYVINNNVLGGDQNLDAKNKSAAAFGRLTWHVNDRIRLTGAARYTKDEKTFDGLASLVTGICASPTHLCPGFRRLPADVRNVGAALASIGYIQPPGVPVYIDQFGTSNAIYLPTLIPVNGKTSPDKVTYRFAAEFEPRQGSLVYTSYETGYRSGGFSFSSVRPVYAPETLDAWTIGTKNRFLDNRLQLNVEGFIWKYKNQQLSHQSYGAFGDIEFVTENVGRSLNKGVEVEAIAKPMRNTTLHADVQYLDARNKNFVFQDADTSALAGLPAGTVPPSENCPATVVPGANLYRIDCSGKRALRSPKWTVNLGLQQAFDLSGDLKLTVQADTHYQSKNIVMFERRDGSVQPSYWITDASITLAASNDKWSLAAFVNNIENKRVFGATYYNGVDGVTTANYGPPRTFGARFSFHFQR